MKKFLIILFGVLILLVGITIIWKTINHTSSETVVPESGPTLPPEPPKPVVTHIPTPTPVRAVYVSSWIASGSKTFDPVLKLIESTEINAVVLDIKDATGRVSFLTDNPIVSVTGSPENRIKNINEFINVLHEKNIYVIGRISTFQDPYLTKVKPEWALTKKSDGSVWKDRKGLSFLDPANKDVWNYTVALANTSYEVGFDEINFDYIRYPSDGNMKDINYKLSPDANGVLATRADNIESFMKFINSELRNIHPEVKTSADLFGLTTTEKTDMGIGQVLEKALPWFDYIGPMIYPSHYAKGEYGIANPATHPYEVVTKALLGAKTKIDTLQADPNISPDIKARVSFSKIRPWLQDFEINKVPYTAEMIKLEMKAVYDIGLDSWMMWDPTNRYTDAAYQ